MNWKQMTRAAASFAAFCTLAAPALADVGGPHVTFSPHGGAAIWSEDLGLAEDVLFGGRFGLMMGSYIGFEGTVDLTPTHDLTPAESFNRVTHLGGGMVLNVAPYSLVNPYLTFGWSNFHFDPQSGNEQNFNGWEAGGGFKFRLMAGNGKRVDLRLDARNVFTEYDSPFVDPASQQNSLLVTAGLQFAMGGTPRDSDADGIVDRRDRCPNTPALASIDEHGCPTDGDGDGVYDGLDRCPSSLAGAVVDAMGCATDGDGDGVADGLDQCPNTPAGAIVAATGCATDGDLDGVADGLDECPSTAKGVMVDARGCMLDGDGDGIHDGLDACLMTPQGVEVDERGCPVPKSAKEVELLDTGLIRLMSVHFRSGSAELQAGSFQALHEVGQILAKWPELKVEIGGHTDSQGNDDFNLRLSEQRAQSVFDYLNSNFPKAQLEQFSVRGYGESRSIASNDTAEGRSQNRRVEFRVMNREILRK